MGGLMNQNSHGKRQRLNIYGSENQWFKIWQIEKNGANFERALKRISKLMNKTAIPWE